MKGGNGSSYAKATADEGEKNHGDREAGRMHGEFLQLCHEGTKRKVEMLTS